MMAVARGMSDSRMSRAASAQGSSGSRLARLGVRRFAEHIIG
jgi:hypothetical protein